ncbi:MAG TPA: hypothetical protein PKW33_09280 [Anaerolineaceae bacterium]|nr:hypothetical protein [Anaerolineaceae bacterium]HPN51767.1 hypothetical protein [Anaerolineaceae bacterium]
MNAFLITAFTILIGLLVLAGYVFSPGLDEPLKYLLNMAAILTSVATLVGVANLLSVHLKKIRSKQNALYSVVVLASFILTILLGLLFGPAAADFKAFVTSIQFPVEASLMALLAVTLPFALIRFMQQRRNTIMAVAFGISVLVFLITSIGFLTSSNIPVINDVVAFINRLPLAGARGLLIGVALGSLTAGIRILLGVDRPYNG